MGIVKPKSKIGGIEEIFDPEVFFGLLGWTDKKFDNVTVRFNVSDTQNFVLETLGNRVHKGNINDVARACSYLGVLIDMTQKVRQPRIVREILGSAKYNSGNFMKIRAEKMIDDLDFESSKVQDDLKRMLEQHGDNQLGKFIISVIEPALPFNWNVNHQPKFRDVKRIASRVKWGGVPLDDEKRFELKRASDNHQIFFRCTERIDALITALKKEFYHFPHAKVLRGMFVKGLHVLAKWYQCNNATVADWYNMTNLLEELHLLKCKDY